MAVGYPIRAGLTEGKAILYVKIQKFLIAKTGLGLMD